MGPCYLHGPLFVVVRVGLLLGPAGLFCVRLLGVALAIRERLHASREDLFVQLGERRVEARLPFGRERLRLLLFDRGRDREPVPRLASVPDAVVGHAAQVRVVRALLRREPRRVRLERAEDRERALVLVRLECLLAARQVVRVRRARRERQSERATQRDARRREGPTHTTSLSRSATRAE